MARGRERRQQEGGRFSTDGGPSVRDSWLRACVSLSLSTFNSNATKEELTRLLSRSGSRRPAGPSAMRIVRPPSPALQDDGSSSSSRSSSHRPASTGVTVYATFANPSDAAEVKERLSGSKHMAGGGRGLKVDFTL